MADQKKDRGIHAKSREFTRREQGEKRIRTAAERTC